MSRYRTTLTCGGMTEAEGSAAPADILEEFRERPWHENVTCHWDAARLVLSAENDFDDDGKALLDEFWDVVIACVKTDHTIRFEIISVEQLAGEA